MLERVLKIVGAVLEIRPEELGLDSSNLNVVAWDSLKQIRLVLALEQEFNVEFSDEQVMDMGSVASIMKHLTATGGVAS